MEVEVYIHWFSPWPRTPTTLDSTLWTRGSTAHIVTENPISTRFYRPLNALFYITARTLTMMVHSLQLILPRIRLGGLRIAVGSLIAIPRRMTYGGRANLHAIHALFALADLPDLIL